ATGQKQVAESRYLVKVKGSKRPKSQNFVVPVLELFPPESDEAKLQATYGCKRPYFEDSLASWLEGWTPNHEELFSIVSAIAAGLHQIQMQASRGHGNLKLKNVLVDRRIKGWRGILGCETNVALTDFAWSAAREAETESSRDLRRLGQIVYELV